MFDDAAFDSHCRAQLLTPEAQKAVAVRLEVWSRWDDADAALTQANKVLRRKRAAFYRPQVNYGRARREFALAKHIVRQRRREYSDVYDEFRVAENAFLRIVRPEEYHKLLPMEK